MINLKKKRLEKKYMTRGINNSKIKKEKNGLIKEKDYITEAYLQGGKAIGKITKKK